MNVSKSYDQYTESEYLELITKLFQGEYSTEEELDILVHKIVDASEHPNGTDILFYPEENIENSPSGILKHIKEWRQANGKPGFKPE
ncbi:Colicin-E7 immunity protein [Pseudomonas sp. IT-P12]|jgi:hypothetical protein|uniref:bacteriocin immunity protein n=1 Tax=Pseudomonas sp. IT-P12 TaxID=3026450 RepID=UPI0039E1B8CC